MPRLVLTRDQLRFEIERDTVLRRFDGLEVSREVDLKRFDFREVGRKR